MSLQGACMLAALLCMELALLLSLDELSVDLITPFASRTFAGERSAADPPRG